MGIAISILTALAMGAIAVAVIYIAYLSVSKLKELIRVRKEKNAKQKVAFGKTSRILQENAKEIIQAAPSMTMEELEEVCDENPFFVVNYDPETDKVIDYQTIKTDGTDEKVLNIVKDEGIILFE
ncbi:MAG: hypothetical protein PHY47_24185 [Lachnospiraceae bacterium]|nr:hypothetical protein [Lachnospiraceae bacterium]